jgi:hypothetical protein
VSPDGSASTKPRLLTRHTTDSVNLIIATNFSESTWPTSASR